MMVVMLGVQQAHALPIDTVVGKPDTGINTPEADADVPNQNDDNDEAYSEDEEFQEIADDGNMFDEVPNDQERETLIEAQEEDAALESKYPDEDGEPDEDQSSKDSDQVEEE